MKNLILHRALSMILATLALVLLSTRVFAQPVVQCTPQGGYVLFYINGVRTGPEDGILNMVAITRASGTSLRNGFPVEFRLGYNPSGVLTADFFETFRVKSIENSLDYVGMLAALMAGKGVPAFAMTPQQRAAAEQLLNDTRANLIARAVDQASQQVPDLQAIIANAREIDPKNPLILFGHSEGTVFTSLLYRALLGGPDPRPDNSMRLISVAAAAAEAPGLLGPEVEDGKAWVTSTTDRIIGLLRIARPNTLNANYPGPLFPEDDFFNAHGLIEIYLNPDYNLRQQVINRLNTAFERVTPPSSIGNCELRLAVSGTANGWQVYPFTRMTDFQLTNRSLFNRTGSPNNTCTTGERGIIFYSQNINIPSQAMFYGPSLVIDAPHLANRPTNRRPCSSFMAIAAIPDPQGVLLPRYRIWANATSRSQTFTDSNTTDGETQLRYDSGDPWLKVDATCILGNVTSTNVFIPSESLQCIGSLVNKDTPLN